MITFWEVCKSILIGAIFGLIFVYFTQREMTYYRRELEEWWTPKKYMILFIVNAVIVGVVCGLFYYFDIL